MTDDSGVRQRRASYRANHRGTKEMDVLLGRYTQARIAEMQGTELALFERFLALPDPTLQAWIFDPGAMGESEFGDLILQLRRFHGLEDGAARKG